MSLLVYGALRTLFEARIQESFELIVRCLAPAWRIYLSQYPIEEETGDRSIKLTNNQQKD